MIIVLQLCSCSHREVSPPPASPPDTLTTPSAAERPGQTRDERFRRYLEDVLVERGLERRKASSLLADPRLVLDPEFILKNLSISPPKDTLETPGHMVYSPAYVEKGRSFIEAHRESFTALQERYGVSPEIITSILIIETRLGTYPQRYYAMRVFANMALAQDPEFIEDIKESYPGLATLLADGETLKVATAKARWASGELYQLIVLADELGLDPHEIKGSVSGALGPAQFIPTTMRKYGADGDGDGKKDPFNMDDAMASIASFLKTSGWRENGEEKPRRTALWIYNHSDIYVNTVLKLYRELSGT